MSVILEVTIDRARWLHGEGGSRSALLRSEDGKMCCIGFVCLKAGFTEDQIRDKRNLAMIRSVAPEVLHPIINSPTTIMRGGIEVTTQDPFLKAYDLNDDDFPAISRQTREQSLIKELGKLGIKIEFTGEYPSW